MQPLTEFMLKLSSDKDFLSEFKRDNNSVMDQAGLNTEQKALVLSKDSQKITEAIAKENPGLETSLRPITISIKITVNLPF